MILAKSINNFIKEVESDSPIPGGGSVSSLVGAFGTALARMYQNLSFNRKKYEASDEATKTEFVRVFAELAEVQKELLSYVIKDAEAYNGVIAAYKLPKESEVEKNERSQAIFDATLLAIDSPLSIMRLSVKALSLLKIIAGKGNDNAISDVAVGAILLASAVEGASLNVLINLTANNQMIHEKILTEYESLLEAMKYEKALVMELVLAKINPKDRY